MIELRILQAHVRDGYDLYLVEKRSDGSSFGMPVVMAPQEEAGIRVEPTMFLDESALQGILEQLWNLGFRPRKTSFGEGELKATKYHLEDMRQLVPLPPKEE